MGYRIYSAIQLIVSIVFPILVYGFNGDLISTEPFIALFPDFLSPEECDNIITYTKTSRQYKGSGDDSVYFDQYPRLPPWLQEIERRMGALSGSPPHPGEEAINIHRISRHIDYR